MATRPPARLARAKTSAKRSTQVREEGQREAARQLQGRREPTTRWSRSRRPGRTSSRSAASTPNSWKPSRPGERLGQGRSCRRTVCAGSAEPRRLSGPRRRRDACSGSAPGRRRTLPRRGLARQRALRTTAGAHRVVGHAAGRRPRARDGRDRRIGGPGNDIAAAARPAMRGEGGLHPAARCVSPRDRRGSRRGLRRVVPGTPPRSSRRARRSACRLSADQDSRPCGRAIPSDGARRVLADQLASTRSGRCCRRPAPLEARHAVGPAA